MLLGAAGSKIRSVFWILHQCECRAEVEEVGLSQILGVGSSPCRGGCSAHRSRRCVPLLLEGEECSLEVDHFPSSVCGLGAPVSLRGESLIVLVPVSPVCLPSSFAHYSLIERKKNWWLCASADLGEISENSGSALLSSLWL